MSKRYRHSDGTWSDYPETANSLSSLKNSKPVHSYEPGATMQVKFEDYGVESKVISEEKGFRHNKGKPRWRNFPMFLMEPLIKVGSANEKHEDNPNGKYPTHNFLKGLKVNDTLDCLHRHLCAFSDPSKPDIDPEDNVHHLAKVAWNALVALYYIENKKEWDDRSLKHE